MTADGRTQTLGLRPKPRTRREAAGVGKEPTHPSGRERGRYVGLKGFRGINGYAPATRAPPIYSTTLDPAFAHSTLSFPTFGMRSHSVSIVGPPCAFASALSWEAVHFGFGVPSPTIFLIAVTYPGL